MKFIGLILICLSVIIFCNGTELAENINLDILDKNNTNLINDSSIAPEIKNSTNKSEKNQLEDFTDWRTWLPMYLGMYRWGIFIIFKVIPSLFYKQKKFIKKKINP